MKISEAEPQIEALIKEYLPDWRFRWDRATSRFGCCHQNLKLITMSKSLVELNDWGQVKDTALHEIAHGLAGKGHGHDQYWKSKCELIGARPERCYSSTVITPPEKWKGICPGCGRIVYGCRRRNISCGKCCKVYNPEYKFIWELNKKGEK